MDDKATSPEFLEENQYRDSSNLGARIRLHKRYSTNAYPLYRWEFDLMLAAMGRHGRILEVGCGRGDLWEDNLERVPDTWQMTLTDVSGGMLEDAREHLGDKRFDWEVADVRKLPFDDDSFDVVLAHFMLYHIPDRRRAISELARVLRPGGALHAATNGRNHMREMRNLERETFGSDTTTPWHEAFNLQNGAEQLEERFGDVVLIRRDDGLRIPDVEPVVDYLLSGRDGEVTDDIIEGITRTVRRRIDEAGEIRVAKESGIFVARDPEVD